MLLNIFREYQSATQKKSWCNANFLQYRSLEYASRARKQLAVLAERVNLEKASCGTNTEKLRRALLEGLYENVAKLQRDEQTYVTVSKYSHDIASLICYSIYVICYSAHFTLNVISLLNI